MKKVAVVTVNFNTEQETLGLLRSIEKITASDFGVGIIIVDNGSKNEFILNKKQQKENITVIRSEVNTGFSGGYNIGMRFALDQHADYILIVNNDTIMHPNMIKNLVEIADSDSKIGISVPKIYFGKGHEFHKERYTKEELGKVFWYAGGWTDWNNVMSVHRGVDEVDHGQYDTTEKTEFASGCCMLIKREVLEKVGIFDDRYFLYYEDADLNQRIRRAGYTIMYVPSAILWHINAASSGGSGNVLQDYFITRNRMLFGMTYAPWRTKSALLRESFRLLFKGRQWQKRGIWDFYTGNFGPGSFFTSK